MVEWLDGLVGFNGWLDGLMVRWFDGWVVYHIINSLQHNFFEISVGEILTRQSSCR